MKIQPPPPKITIVIPMFNSERYIKTCIDSILIQSLQDFEVIVIDDRSTDRSVEIVQSYDDPRIRLVRHGKNSGVGFVRNLGLDFSRGKYVYFMDSDDAILPQTLETLFKAAEKSGADVVHMNGYYYVGEDFKIPSVASVQKYQQWNCQPRFLEEDLVERLQKNFVEYGVHMTPWIKLQRRDFLIENQIYFPNIAISDDIFQNFVELCFARKIQMIECCGYLYRMSRNSLTRTNPERRIQVILQSIVPALKYMRETWTRINLPRDFQITLEVKLINDMLEDVIMNMNNARMKMQQLDDMLTPFVFQSEQIDPILIRALFQTIVMKLIKSR